MSILVTGAHGQLGSELQQLALGRNDLHFHFTDRDDLDITDAQAVAAAIAKTGARLVINCAAYTAVDKAETDLDLAMAINSTGAANLAAESRNAGARFIHVSTDYVFDGRGTRPYREDDPVNPVNAYGPTKWKGEERVMGENENAIIIRTSWVYSEYGANFVKTMMRLMASRPEVGVVADQWGSPTYARDLAAVILEIWEKGVWVPGTYHYSNEGDITWFQFAQAIQQILGSSCLVKPLTTAEYPTPASRPGYSVMDKRKIVETFGITLRPWRESLELCMRRLQQNVSQP